VSLSDYLAPGPPRVLEQVLRARRSAELGVYAGYVRLWARTPTDQCSQLGQASSPGVPDRATGQVAAVDHVLLGHAGD
jgi:hypothetical protein